MDGHLDGFAAAFPSLLWLDLNATNIDGNFPTGKMATMCLQQKLRHDSTQAGHVLFIFDTECWADHVSCVFEGAVQERMGQSSMHCAGSTSPVAAGRTTTLFTTRGSYGRWACQGPCRLQPRPSPISPTSYWTTTCSQGSCQVRAAQLMLMCCISVWQEGSGGSGDPASPAIIL